MNPPAGLAARRGGDEIVIASRNAHKIDEIRRILGDAGLSRPLVGIHEVDGDVGEVAETEVSFGGNALLKARAVHAATGLPSLADDSGLAVDVLGGMPGIFSARWSGRHGDDEANLDLLLAQLSDVGDEHRQAAFVCAVAYVDGAQDIVVADEVRGRLIRERRGENGFGYDPIFVPDGYTVTTAELDSAAKDAISHRGRALRAMAQRLAEQES